MLTAAKRIRSLGARAVLIKGGHLGQMAEVSEAIDVLDNEGTVMVLRAPFIPGANIRGSGCMLSAAIAAGLGQGMSLENSVRQAKDFVLKALHKT
jgi:hydroxymethylpyrimidine/phosphomethylpyrimidine kinase